MRVIAKAYGDEPLDRIAVGHNAKLVYVVAQSVISSSVDTTEIGVGFPRDSIFKFDDSLYHELRAAYSAADLGRLYELWLQATPLTDEAVLHA
jgi:hypothetical protein